MIAQYFHYTILETKPLSALEEFKEHRRLRVFYYKGCKCVQCGIEGTQLALGQGRGSLHIDVYTDDFYPLTVDHIIPKSKGGSNDLDNLQPMCCRCNWSKGNGDKPGSSFNKPKYSVKYTRVLKLEVGLEVYRKIPCSERIEPLGKILEITVNPHTKRPAVICELKPDSFFHFNQIRIL